MFHLLFPGLAGKKSKGRKISKVAKTPKAFNLEALESRWVPTTILRTSSPVFYNDLNPPAGATPLTSAYASYQITNNDGVDYADAWASIGNFKAASGPVVVNAATNSATQFHIGALPNGATKTAYFYLGSNADNISADQIHTVTVFNGDPTTGKSLVAKDFSFTSVGGDKAVQNTIQAEANKVEGYEVQPESLNVGSSFTLKVTGHTGTIGAANVVSFTPAAWSSWRADAFQLTSTTITLTAGNSGTFTDTLAIPTASLTSKADTEYVALYKFRAISTTSAPVLVHPISYVSSGENVKHSKLDKQDWAVPKVGSSMTLSNSVDKTSMTTGGQLTYTLKLNNSASKTDASVEKWIDTLPAGVNYVAGSATLDGKSIADPVISGQKLTWSGLFTVGAGSSSSLVFKATCPSTAGTYINGAIVKAGANQIDSTADGEDDRPATCSTVVTGNAAPKINSANATTFTYGTSGSFNVTSIGDATITYSISTGSLPSGVKLDPATGLLSGIPASGTTGSYNFTIVASNSAGKDTQAFTLTVAKAALKISADPKSKTYGDSDPALTYTISGLKGSDTSSVVTGSLARSAGENAGNYAINQGTVATNSNYAITYVSANLTINKATLKVVADSKSKTYGDNDPALTYSLSGFKKTDTSSIVTGALSREAGSDVGTYAIGQGTLSAGANYDVSYFGANLVITAKAITVTPDMQAKTYGDADPALTYKVTTGSLVSGDKFSGALTRAAGENVGKYGITQGTLTPGGNYTVTFAAANLTIGARSLTVTADEKSKSYGNSDPALTYKITTGFLATGDTLTGSLSRAAGENVGKYMIGQGTLNASANYNLSYVGANLTISQRNITIAADDKTKVYGEKDPALTYQITLGSLVSGDKLTGAPSRIGGEGAGTYAITKDTLTAGPNYNLAFVGGNLVITPKTIVVTAQTATKVYGDVDPSFTYKVAPGGLINGDILKGSLGRVSGENVGSYDIAIGSLNGSPNYTINLVSAKFSITPREIGVTANPATKVYGNNDPVFTFQVTTGSLINGDKLTGSIGRESGENIGIYALNKGTLGNTNYKVGFVGNKLTVTPRAITVTANTISKTYGDADPVLTYKVTTSSLAFGDTLTGSMTRAAGEKIGTYAVSKGTLASSPNYQMTFVAGKLNITQRNLVVTAKDVTKTYGTTYTFAGNEYSTSGLVFGDSVTSVILGSYGAPSTALVGTFATNVSKAIGNGLANYNISYVKGTLTVSKANLFVTANDAAKVYGTTAAFGSTQFTTSGLVNGDKVNSAVFTSTGATKTAIVGTYPIVGSKALGSGLQNYNITYLNGNLTVNKASLVINVDSRLKTQGATANFIGNEFTTTGLVNSDMVTSATLSSLGATSSAALGSYDIVATNAAGNGLSNYTITYVNGTMKVVAPEDYNANLGNGTFTTDATGKVQIDYRYDGGGYRGQMGIYSLAGMTAYTPGSPEYIKEVARRVLTASSEGYLVIDDFTDAAKHSEKLKTDGLFNSGTYKGVQTFQMDSNAQFGIVLIPNGTFKEVFANPTIDGAKRALFSNSKANPSQAVNGGAQLADLTGASTIFSWEDYRLDGGTATGTPVCDRDYNDLIFALIGAKSDAVGYKGLADPAKDITKDPVFSTIIS